MWLTGCIYYVHVTIDKRFLSVSNLLIQLNYKGIKTVYLWRIGHAKLKQM